MGVRWEDFPTSCPLVVFPPPLRRQHVAEYSSSCTCLGREDIHGPWCAQPILRRSSSSLDTKVMQYDNFLPLPWAVAAILGAVACLGATWWWRGMRKSGSGRGGKGAKKALAHSPGVRVVCVQVWTREDRRKCAEERASL